MLELGSSRRAAIAQVRQFSRHYAGSVSQRIPCRVSAPSPADWSFGNCESPLKKHKIAKIYSRDFSARKNVSEFMVISATTAGCD
jgi:hypothetical protein